MHGIKRPSLPKVFAQQGKDPKGTHIHKVGDLQSDASGFIFMGLETMQSPTGRRGRSLGDHCALITLITLIRALGRGATQGATQGVLTSICLSSRARYAVRRTPRLRRGVRCQGVARRPMPSEVCCFGSRFFNRFQFKKLSHLRYPIPIACNGHITIDT